MSQLTLKVPKGLAGGDTLQVEQDGQLFNVQVPPGLAPGDEFIVHVPSKPPVYGAPVGGAAGVVAGQPYGRPAPGQDPCRGCGRELTRRPGVRPNTAQWYRCEQCEGNITFCSLM